MSKYGYFALIGICILSAANASILLENSEERTDGNTLVLLHVLFRHGDRTATVSEMYPNDPYLNKTYPEGFGQLTQKGKLKEYMIGRTLRNRYHKFLGEFNPDMLYARSTNYTRTRISFELVAAGLFPPTKEQEIFEGLNWQPILCEYESTERDFLLEDPNYNRPKYQDMYKEYEASEKKSFKAKNTELYKYVSTHSGIDIQTPFQIYNLAFVLNAEESLGLKLPEWTNSVWPDNITAAAADEYHIQTGTPQMRQLSGGVLLRKIFDDTKAKINGDDSDKNKKIFLYSAHENNLAAQLILLNAFYPHVPPYGSFIIYEVHKINNIYGFKILYQDYTSEGKLKVLDLPGCGSFCPLDQFELLYRDQFVKDEDICINKNLCQ